MPIGAFKLNGISKFTAAAVASRPVSITNVNTVLTSSGKISSSAQINSNTGRYLLTDNIPDIQLTGNFTIEGWGYALDYNAWVAPYIKNWGYTGSTTSSTGSFAIWQGGDDQIRLVLNGQTEIATSAVRNTWYHFAAVRNGTTVTFYKNGVSAGTRTWSDTLSISGQKFLMGAESTSGNSLNGRFDEIRISKSARYTTNFTPSTTAFSNDANTLLLLHLDSTPFVDSTT